MPLGVAWPRVLSVTLGQGSKRFGLAITPRYGAKIVRGKRVERTQKGRHTFECASRCEDKSAAQHGLCIRRRVECRGLLQPLSEPLKEEHIIVQYCNRAVGWQRLLSQCGREC